jgi:hypothetical protein
MLTRNPENDYLTASSSVMKESKKAKSLQY